MKAEEPSFLRTWLVPILSLASVAVATVGVLYTFDRYVSGGPGSVAPPGPLSYFFFDQDHITDAASALGGMVSGVLGIVISVVSIVVQLSAERHPGVTAMFFKDRTNILVMAFYVIACVSGVWVSLSIHADFVPRVTVTAMMCTTTACLVIMAPYFAYVFRFLEPVNIIARIRRDAFRVVQRGARSSDADERAHAQAAVIGAMEELTDITSSSVSGKDKIIASRAVDALKDLMVEYQRFKKSASEAWFEIGEEIRDNPDFVAMDPESLGDLVTRRTWVEWKAMRQLMGIFNEALGNMRDINYLVAIDTRYVGEAAADGDDGELVQLVLRYMNSYMRATLNARDVRTAYNVLNQYRLLVESLLKKGHSTSAVAAVGHMKYYANVSFELGLPFVTETIAYDVGAVCQVAHDLACKDEDALLKLFLDLDRPQSERGQDHALKGVRKAQVKLAAYYVQVGEEARARRIFQDMTSEPAVRVRAIKDELEGVETKDFWEIIDRGRNFEFMPAAQKAAMRTFFQWFEARRDEPPASPLDDGAAPA